MAKKSIVPLLLGAGAALLLLSRGSSDDGCEANCDEVDDDGGLVAGIRYREFRTEGMPANAQAPMLIFFHGLGSSSASLDSWGKSWVQQVKGPVRVIIPESPRLTSPNKYFTWFGSFQARTKDQEGLTKIMRQAGQEMDAFLCQIVQCRPTSGAPVVAGQSQGGSMAYLVSTLSPGRVRGAVAISGWLPRDLWSPSMAKTFAAHGTQDAHVPYSSTEEYWEIVKNAGAPLSTKSFSSGHDFTGSIFAYAKNRINELLGYG